MRFVGFGRVVVAVAIVGALAGAAPGAAMLNRTWVSSVPIVEVDWDGGLGVFDPADPDNTCLALTLLRTPDGKLGGGTGYYDNFRMAWDGLDSSTPFGAISIPGTGTPLDDCFALTFPGQHVGTSEFDLYTGFQFWVDGLLDPVSVAVGPFTWLITTCPITSAAAPAVDQGGGMMSGVAVTCTGTVTDFSAYVTSVELGRVGTGSLRPFTWEAAYGFAGSAVLKSCLSITDEFDVLTGMLLGSAADQSWFSVLRGNTGSVRTGIEWSAAATFSTIDQQLRFVHQDGQTIETGC